MKATVGRIFLYLSILFLIFTFLNIYSNDDKMFLIHILTGVLFSFFALTAVFIGLIHNARRKPAYLILTIILFELLLIDLILLLVNYYTYSLYETVPLVLCNIALLFTNFTESFKIRIN